MKKMPCVFVRQFVGGRVATITEEVSPGCEWVLAGDGVATRKWDGTAVLVSSGVVFARYDAKRGKQPPPGAIPCIPEPDPVTGHWPHWVEANRAQDCWIREAHANAIRDAGAALSDGTYEAVGPNIGGNADGLPAHTLVRHGDTVVALPSEERAFASLRARLECTPWEGIVFHHEDGRMAKIRRDDFGFPWPMTRTPAESSSS